VLRALVTRISGGPVETEHDVEDDRQFRGRRSWYEAERRKPPEKSK